MNYGEGRPPTTGVEKFSIHENASPEPNLEADPETDPEQVLGISISVTPEEFLSRYRELAKRFHPDRRGGDSTAMQKINQARDSFVLGQQRKFEHALVMREAELNERGAEDSILKALENKPLVIRLADAYRRARERTHSLPRNSPASDIWDEAKVLESTLGLSEIGQEDAWAIAFDHKTIEDIYPPDYLKLAEEIKVRRQWENMPLSISSEKG